MDEIEKLVGEAAVLRRPSRRRCGRGSNAQVRELLDTGSISEDRLAQEVALWR